MHGNIWRARCLQAGHIVDQTGVTALETIPPRCHCGAWLRPDIVWFGEPLPAQALVRAEAALHRADTVVVIGTSGVVYPVADFPRIAKQSGAFVIEINPEPTPLSPLCDLTLRGTAGAVLPELDRLVTVTR
ncbi:MAG: hypothetical protein COX57_13075 [Alphaproteobacteria bacterium CG_4_10_14_0_2_um_filter_63_37]|nr:MAG: hypothetical protein AUJ55_06105 [Proteobacteria bacterium CG1_02_64_396]PJA23559.1 MAG: hypothetical protein COX57_13075 [Alphaproteobacteria bacterium CG_4_10_14_0_2_um_filter_63_37]